MPIPYRLNGSMVSGNGSSDSVRHPAGPMSTGRTRRAAHGGDPGRHPPDAVPFPGYLP